MEIHSNEKNMLICFIFVSFSFLSMFQFVKIYMKGTEFNGINFLFWADDFLYFSSLTNSISSLRLEVKSLSVVWFIQYKFGVSSLKKEWMDEMRILHIEEKKTDTSWCYNALNAGGNTRWKWRIMKCAFFWGKKAHNTRRKNMHLNAWAKEMWECQRIKYVFYRWVKMRIIHVCRPMHEMHGQRQHRNANVRNSHFICRNKCAWYTWVFPRIKSWAKQKWECPRRICTFYTWRKMRVIHVKKKHAYYAWAKPQWKYRNKCA